MAEYIGREALLKRLEVTPLLAYGIPEHVRDGVIDLVRQQTAADVAPVRHGRWEQCFEDWRKQIEGDKCSACGFEHYGCNISNYNFCPNCGARMDGGADNGA